MNTNTAALVADSEDLICVTCPEQRHQYDEALVIADALSRVPMVADASAALEGKGRAEAVAAICADLWSEARKLFERGGQTRVDYACAMEDYAKRLEAGEPFAQGPCDEHAGGGGR